MRRPRVGLRAFLLMATLASLLAATIATWARAGRYDSAIEHAFQAQRRRVEAAWCEERIGWLLGRIEAEGNSPGQFVWQAQLRQTRARKASAIIEAEGHERLARF